MAKDQLARGARSATYGNAGVGESPLLLKLAEQEATGIVDDGEPEIPVQPVVKPSGPQFKFIPAGETVLVRQEEAATVGKTYTDQASALNDKSNDLVLVTDEEKKKQDAPAQGWIVVAGPEATFAEGDHVVFGKYSGAAFQLNGEWLLLMQNGEILGTLVEV